MENRIELRNKKFMKPELKTYTQESLNKRKEKRAKGFAVHRQMDVIFNVDPGSSEAKEIIEKFDVDGLNDSRVIFLVQKIRELWKFEDLKKSLLFLLVNLTNVYNAAGEEMCRSGLFDLICLAINEIEYTEDALICIGNVYITGCSCLVENSAEGVIKRIFEYLSGDYEKPEESVKTALWCTWCICYKNSINPIDMNLVSSLASELIFFDEFRTEVFQIVYCLSSSELKQDFLEKIGYVICDQEYLKKDHKMYSILILNNLIRFDNLRKYSIEYVKKLVFDENEVKKAAFEYLNKCRLDEIKYDFNVLLQAVQDSSSTDQTLKRVSSYYLNYSLSAMAKEDIFAFFDCRVLNLFKDALGICSGEVEASLVNICKVVLECGRVEEFIQTGCLQGLSMMFYNSSGNEVCKKIEDIFRCYIEIME